MLFKQTESLLNSIIGFSILKGVKINKIRIMNFKIPAYNIDNRKIN
ncbi:hypothetical protein [Caloramator sp. E03]|nr:hypothetical protein [Caloramator sp. E03]